MLLKIPVNDSVAFTYRSSSTCSIGDLGQLRIFMNFHANCATSKFVDFKGCLNLHAISEQCTTTDVPPSWRARGRAVLRSCAGSAVRRTGHHRDAAPRRDARDVGERCDDRQPVQLTKNREHSTDSYCRIIAISRSSTFSASLFF